MLAIAFPVVAQTYPSKPIRFIVPFAPGGGGDIIVRTVAQKLTERLGQSVVVDNRTGAGGNIGTETAARSPNDGYTLLMANVAPMAINVSLYRNLPYDPVRDFTPITLMASFPNVLVVHPSVPARSIKELIALARAKPGTLTYASAGSGSTTHLAAEFFRSQAGIDLIHVPYKGGGPALVDLLAGQVTMYFGSMPASLPHITTGRLRALGVTSLQRSTAAPDIPTLAESGFPGFEAVTWIGAVAPAGVAQPIVSRLNTELTEIMHERQVRERLEAQGAEPITDTPEAFAAYIRDEIRKWATVVRQAGISLQ
ncbi:MAG TPA: tripartite tricarboxylate transporter substrate binding protein [Burkholderiales bacterium]|nr:tripartite tricarboxylate transporter substrate binding protein [Burkholderiales bacterium]